MNSPFEFHHQTSGKLPLLYYLIFPIDAWLHDPDQAFLERKHKQIWPVLIFLMPVVVLLAGSMLHLGLFSSLFLYGCEALLLTVVACLSLRVRDLGHILELFFNFWLSFVLITVIFLMIAFVASWFV